MKAMFLSLALALALLSGCASLPAGVEMTESERVACAAEGCSVWTLAELRKLITLSMQKGYASGKGSI
jgi:starvation-inducible outer membrane lipoprotein